LATVFSSDSNLGALEDGGPLDGQGATTFEGIVRESWPVPFVDRPNSTVRRVTTVSARAPHLLLASLAMRSTDGDSPAGSPPSELDDVYDRRFDRAEKTDKKRIWPPIASYLRRYMEECPPEWWELSAAPDAG
jgi:hypothetical protein